MRKSFYQFALKYRGQKVKDRYGKFADSLFKDHSFPKQSSDYNEISEYVELNAYSLEASSVFDELWDIYQVEEEL